MKDRITLRAEEPDDAEFLYEVYASTRAEEIALTGWSEGDAEQFLRSQLALQSHHYHTYFPESSFDIVLDGGERVGRLYVERKSKAIIIHDIALIPAARGKGIGSHLLSEIISDADASGLPVQIFVEQHNPARNLYARLGFRAAELDGIYYLMERLPLGVIPESRY